MIVFLTLGFELRTMECKERTYPLRHETLLVMSH